MPAPIRIYIYKQHSTLPKCQNVDESIRSIPDISDSLLDSQLRKYNQIADVFTSGPGASIAQSIELDGIALSKSHAPQAQLYQRFIDKLCNLPKDQRESLNDDQFDLFLKFLPYLQSKEQENYTAQKETQDALAMLGFVQNFFGRVAGIEPVKSRMHQMQENMTCASQAKYSLRDKQLSSISESEELQDQRHYLISKSVARSPTQQYGQIQQPKQKVLLQTTKVGQSIGKSGFENISKLYSDTEESSQETYLEEVDRLYPNITDSTAPKRQAFHALFQKGHRRFKLNHLLLIKYRWDTGKCEEILKGQA